MLTENLYNFLKVIGNVSDDDEEIKNAINSLDHQEADIIRKRFGIDSPKFTIGDIAAHYKINRDRVRSIEMSALRKIKHKLAK